MSDREFAFGQYLAGHPMGELESDLAQAVFNAGWDAREVHS